MKSLFLTFTRIWSHQMNIYAEKRPAQPNKQKSVEKEIDALLSKMTIEEKGGQMTQHTIESLSGTSSNYDSIVIDYDKMKKTIVDYKIGSILNTSNGVAQRVVNWRNLITTVQDFAMQMSLKIPVLYDLDAIHEPNLEMGFALFPQQIGLAATFDTSLIR